MMGLFEHWPYVNFHDLNLDWIIKEFPKVYASRDEAKASAEASAESAAASQLSAEAALASQEAAHQSELNAAQSEENAADSEASAKNYADHIADPVAGLVTDWLEDNITPTTPAVDASLTVSGAAADAKVTGDEITALKTDVETLNNVLEIETVYPVNRFNTYSGVVPPASAEGSDTPNANNSTTDFIVAKHNDKIYCGSTANIALALTSYNPVFITEYDANKNWLYRSAQYPAVDDAFGKKIYTVTQADTEYVRVTFANTMLPPDRFFEIAVNIDTSSYIYYQNYTDPYGESERLSNIEASIETSVNKKIIDCWGDSRTEMIANSGTSYCDYLQTTLGNEYNVCNYGISSQSSGMCAARLGSNEVFISLTNNQIPASGEVQLTDIKCSSGNNKNLYAYSSTAYIPCVINGVRGRLSRASISTYDNVKFLRDSAGSAISVKPRSKIVVDDMNSKHHACVFWWGKNDFSSAVPYVESGILDNYKKAVEYIGHDKFVILGETCSISESYETGGTNRTYLENINSALASTYPDNYIDINSYLSSVQALTDVGLTPTAEDYDFISKGFPCYQLMRYSTDTSDTAHPNEKGREAIAHKLYSWMNEKGWLE